MSTLVAYDSSSEDEEPLPKADTSNTPTQGAALEAIPRDELTLITEAGRGPLMGPSMPSNALESYDGYENENEAGSSMSERDMIRYLTQASHPMTEMPSSPPGSPDAAAAAKFKHFLGLKSKGVHFNEDLAMKSAFKNPSLLYTLTNRAGLNSSSMYRTSLPLSVFDETLFPAIGFKEALLRNQQTIKLKEDAEKKTLAATGKRVVEFTSGGVSGASSATSSPGAFHKRHKK